MLVSLYAGISDNIKSGYYAKPGGYELYKKETQNLEVKYQKTPDLGIKVS